MCFADAAQYSANYHYHHRNQQSSRPATALFSCAADALIRDMRLPRLTTARTANAPADDAAGGGAPHRPAEEEEPLVAATKKVTKTTNSTTTTATATTPLPRAFAASASDPAMRRCQSARPRESDSDNADREFASTMQRTRSHSQKTAYMRTRELPIPAASGSPFPESGSNAAEESDLVRMYDYATWNMYERIVSARRRRLAQIDLQQRREAEEGGDRRGGADPAAAAPSSASAPRLAATSDAVAVPSANKREERQQQQQQQRPSLQTLNKNLSHDENSTLATADETDRASTTSSWSRADSPIVHHPEHGLPSLRRLGFSSSSLMGCAYPNNEGRRVSTTNNNEEDSFIFELDM